MPSTKFNRSDSSLNPCYFGTYLATKRKDPETGNYTIRLTKSLALPGQTRYSPNNRDLFDTYCARNKDNSEIAAVLEDDCIRIWDKHSLSSKNPEAEELREARFNAPDGFYYPIDAKNQAIIIPAHYVEKLQLKRDIIISATYDDLDPGETFCIHKPGPLEKILKKQTKCETAHQR